MRARPLCERWLRSNRSGKMSPDISKQFRGIESFLETQQPQERISFLGSDISPVVDIDPGTARVDQFVEEFSTITGPATVHNFLEPAPGFFKIYIMTSLSQNDPAGRDSIIRVESIATGRFFIIQQNGNLLPGATIPNGRQIIIPRGFRLGATVLLLAAPNVSNFIAMSLTLPIGGAIPPGP